MNVSPHAFDLWPRRSWRRAARAALLVIAALWLLGLTLIASAQVPHAANRYRADLTRQARQVWGLDAPVATFAAQIHTESLWRLDAVSPAGARGLAQFMPGTETWINGLYRWQGDAMNPTWALRALVTYNRWHWDRIKNTANDCERMAFAMSAYNGGLGWVQRDRALASSKGLDSARYWGAVESVNAGRSAVAIRENREYPRLILKVREPIYQTAGWGRGVCDSVQVVGSVQTGGQT